jgi:excisionase family DNA binding protein
MCNDDPVLTSTEAGRLLGVSTSTAQAWMESGMLASWRTLGGHRRTRLSDVHTLLGFRTAGATKANVDPDFRPDPAVRYLSRNNERKRLAWIESSGLIAAGYEARFDRLVRLASQTVNMPIAFLAFATSTHLRVKASVGSNVQEVPRGSAFGAYALLQRDIFEVQDAAADRRFAHNPLVRSAPYVRFYAGVALNTDGGLPLGTLCVMDVEPRRLRAAEVQALIDLGDIASREAQLPPAGKPASVPRIRAH